MIDRETLKFWSQPPEGTDRYLKPFVCRGMLARGGAAVVGLNPATAIGPTDIPFDQYLDLLLDLDAFTEFYRDLRVRRGKRASSPTRTGLNGMAGWLSALGWDCVIDTNVSPYPTSSREALDRVPARLQSRWVFKELIRLLAPRLLILHGEDALDDFTSDVAPHLAPPIGIKFSSLVNQSPRLGELVWGDGLACEVYVCPHLRFFGHRGGPKYSSLSEALRHASPTSRG